jgi:hypothetical protein
MKLSVYYLLVTLFALGLFLNSQDVAGEEGGIDVLASSPNGVSKVYGSVTLMTAENQKLWIENGIKEISRVIVESPFRYEPEITWHSNDVVEVMIATGSPGRFSIFYDLRNDLVSGEMWFVVAFDERRGIALLGEDRLRLVNVFTDKEILEIRLSDLQMTAITFLVIEDARFDDNGNLHLRYTNNAGGINKYVVKSSDID